ncbi:FAD dependent oxidoreductase [Myriangium duriaei CBS 260.36]|uniref:L-2-hydroxyglutarate dehydrogenase, mitochondrial n=1 Tax=Myriangium duriaei CBS 260.36 TaxID=1168546 RepID=A0A9P4MLN8_9PEZI|nr:FAD dependent oxidoreductase [Myriangium duriaei CBS 260.36]
MPLLRLPGHLPRHLIRPHQRCFSTTPSHHADFTHTIIGGGAVGLAIARRLQQRPDASTVLIERHGAVGTETSSRNSEVIHAGLYYGTDTLKAKLCVRGKELLYQLCSQHQIPHSRVGKLIVAQDSVQREALEGLARAADALGVETGWLSPSQVTDREPDVRAAEGALWSPTTGIIDSHGYMAFLAEEFEAAGGDTALGNEVVGVERVGGEWRVDVRSGDGKTATISSEVLVNAAGLAAIPLSNSILPEGRRLKPYYAKGTYYSYAAREPRTKTLVYPAPVKGHGGLGTHLTLDLRGRVRFGPDVQWVEDAGDVVPREDLERRKAAVEEIRAYLPGLQEEKLEVDYCGIRPKLAGKDGGGGKDFYIKKEEGFEGFVNLLGIESPGLTSSLAIADEVHRLLYE